MCIRCDEGRASRPSDGQCQTCHTRALGHCLYCHFDYGYKGFRCDVCKERYILEDGACKPIRADEYKDAVYGERYGCPGGAKQCEDVGLSYPVITRCEDGRVIVQDDESPLRYFCRKGSRATPICADGYVYIEQSPRFQSLCQKCPVYDPKKKKAYYKDIDDNNKCKLCPPHAKSCWMKDGIIHIGHDQCQEGYQVHHKTLDSKRECVKCPAKCTAPCGNEKLSQKNQMECFDCNEGYYLEKGARDCERCMANCKICDNPVECKNCMSGFALNSQKQCIPCPNNCEECAADKYDIAQCSYNKCATGFGLLKSHEFYCAPCPDYCLQCDIEGTCEECESGWYITDDKQCRRCFIENCVSCEDGNICKVCEDRYYLSADHQCYPSPGNCEVVNEGDIGGICEKCESGWYITHDGQCRLCAENCASCEDENICNVCENMYYLSTNTCHPFPDNCAEVHEGICMRCVSDSAAWSNGPPDCTTGCNLGDYYYDYYDGCYECPFDCKNCQHGALCTECLTGYAWDMYQPQCIACPSNCATCSYDHTNSLVCDECFTGYAWDMYQPQCTECPSNCATCSYDHTNSFASFVCHECYAGYGINSASGNCELCPPGCRICHEVTGDCETDSCIKCLECAENNRQVEEQCTPCPKGCSSCHFNATTGRMHCDDCTSRYVLANDVDAVLCKRCPADCKICSSLTECKVCDDHYALKDDECMHCTELKSNCATCQKSYGKSYECSACVDGYILKNNITGVDAKCIPIPHDLSCLGQPVIDPPPRCNVDSCVNSSTITPDYKCAIQCYHCGNNTKFDDDGSFDNGTFDSLEVCKKAQTEPCTTRSCYGVQQWEGGNLTGIIGGCLPFPEIPCDLDSSINEIRSEILERRCCGDRCNSWLMDQRKWNKADKADNIKGCFLVPVFAIIAMFL